MTKTEINYFIEEMGLIGDLWTEEQVENVYGNRSLEEALNERKAAVDMHLNNIFTVYSAFGKNND